MRKVAGTLAVLAALAGTMAACGSGSKELSASEFRTQANAVCRDVTRRILELQGKATEATRTRSLEQAADAMTDGIARMDEITPPRRLAARYEQLKAWQASRRDAALVLAKPGARLSGRLERAVNAHHNPAFQLAHELGVRSCS